MPSILISTASLSVLLAYFIATTSNAGAPLCILSNGTHPFRRTVLLVSFDGLRPDYLLRGLTPHLVDISEQGIHAEYMQPIFPVSFDEQNVSYINMMVGNRHGQLQYAAQLPISVPDVPALLTNWISWSQTLTFPNHWTLLTGLYAESHGVIANDFYAPQYRSKFVNDRPGESRWWLGEPIWETVERAGLYSANIMWPGPSTTTSGVTPRYQVPFSRGHPPEEKTNQVLEWIDLPFEQRPQLILVYEPILDQVGHTAGPDSALVNKTLPIISNFAHTLVQRLHHERNLSHILDVVFVSDHGMEDTSSWEMVYMDDILCHQQDAKEQGWPACANIQSVDGWPSMGLWFEPGVNVTKALSHLVLASESRKFDVYTTDTFSHGTPSELTIAPKMPERHHYSSSPRLAPIWVIPRVGYALTDHAENGSLMSTGNHGYDNEEDAMRAVFISQGPFAESVKARIRKEGHGEYVLPPFENVELYNLVVRLLGIDRWASETNGTEGFWDQWIDR